MIVGHGDIAKALIDREGAILFASGVSDSQCTDEAEYSREKKMIEALSINNFGYCFFYFSSISIFFKTSRYTKHKQEMEGLIRTTFRKHNIIRLGNISWGSNPNTFLNYIKDRRNNNKSYEVRDEIKFMIDKEQFRAIVGGLPLDKSQTISIFGDAMKVQEAMDKYLKESECSKDWWYLKNG